MRHSFNVSVKISKGFVFKLGYDLMEHSVAVFVGILDKFLIMCGKILVGFFLFGY